MKKKKYHLPKSSFLAVKIGIRPILRLRRRQIYKLFAYRSNWGRARRSNADGIDKKFCELVVVLHTNSIETHRNVVSVRVHSLRGNLHSMKPITYLSSAKSEDYPDTNFYSQKWRFLQVIFFLLHFSPERKLNFETNYVWKFSFLT